MRINNRLAVTALSLLLVFTCSCPAAAPGGEETDKRLQSDGKGWGLDQAQVTDTKRPRVLLIGDSILNGYRSAVIKSLSGKAYVDTWVNPYCQSENTNKVLAEVLAKGPYDVVHFNMGLHGWQEGRIKPGTFEPLTMAYVEVIRKTMPGAKVIWASSTPVTVKGKPTELDEAINTVIIEHNRMAAKVMTEMNVPVNDFYSLLVPHLEMARGDQFHWTAPAYQLLADAAVAAIMKNLPNGSTKATEPTNAQESADKKAAENRATDAKYAAWVATLPADQQAWEKVLQENLGGFYLPIHKREKADGKSNAWDFVQDDPTLPRVLLIGDSVSRGYTLATRKALAGKANVHRAPENCGPTANGIKKLDIWLGDGKWDIIHFNFGIHDRATPLPEYSQRLQTIVERLKKTGATVIWASTTPIPDDPAKKQTAASIVEHNAAAAAVMEKNGVMIDDLFAAITPNLATMQNPNDVHFNSSGYDFLGEQVGKSIESARK